MHQLEVTRYRSYVERTKVTLKHIQDKSIPKKKVIISFNGADCLKKAEWRQRIPVDSGSRYLFFESLMDYMHRFDKFTWTFISYMQVYVTVFQKDAMSPI